MKQFGKFENNVFSFAPKILKDAKFTYFNPTEEKYKEFNQKLITSKHSPIYVKALFYQLFIILF